MDMENIKFNGANISEEYTAFSLLWKWAKFGQPLFYRRMNCTKPSHRSSQMHSTYCVSNMHSRMIIITDHQQITIDDHTI